MHASRRRYDGVSSPAPTTPQHIIDEDHAPDAALIVGGGTQSGGAAIAPSRTVLNAVPPGLVGLVLTAKEAAAAAALPRLGLVHPSLALGKDSNTLTQIRIPMDMPPLLRPTKLSAFSRPAAACMRRGASQARILK